LSLNRFTYNRIVLIVGFSTVIMAVSWIANPISSKADPHYNNIVNYEAEPLPLDSPEIDLPYPFKDGLGGPKSQNSGGLYLKNPSNVKSGFEYDPETGTYNYYEKMGDNYFKYPTYMDFDEYINYDSKKIITRLLETKIICR
jgi:hypothetical protein